jgi:hypothetical protein
MRLRRERGDVVAAQSADCDSFYFRRNALEDAIGKVE